MDGARAGAPAQKAEGGALQEESPERRLSQLLGDSLEGKIGEKIGAFGGLLTREAAVRLLCQENGISTEKKLALSEARASVLPFSFSARVDRIFPIQQFPGGSMRTVRLHISDKSGEATLVLWNEQVKMSEGNLLCGDTIECSGAYVRAGEISVGRHGAVSRAGASGALPIGKLAEGICNVEGQIMEVDAVRSYMDRRTGEKKTMHPFSICSDGKCVRAVAWSLPEGASLPRAGEQVVLENASFKNGELHLNSFSRIVAAGSSGSTGKFMGAVLEGEEAVLSIGEEKFRMAVPDALALLGVQSVPPGVDASTLLSIKAHSLEGKGARYFSEGGALASLKFEN